MTVLRTAPLLGAILLAACDPVLLIADTTADTDARPPPGAASGTASFEHAAGSGSHEMPPNDASVAMPPTQHTATPSVDFTLKSLNCGNCFELTAHGIGGVPPYRYEWDDGSSADSRLLCLRTSELTVTVVAEDSTGERSNARVLNLRPTTDNTSSCSENLAPPPLCLTNPSFEGTAAINTGQGFEAKPWSDCVDTMTAADATTNLTTNTPDIANDVLDPVTGIAPHPTEGLTYLAMTAGEQASHPLCEAFPAHAKTSIRLDAVRFDLGGPDLYLQIWGGDSSSCSRRQLLWSSPALLTTWQNYCVTLEPSVAIDQITLRADTPMPMPMLATTYLAVDNIVPVESCPSAFTP